MKYYLVFLSISVGILLASCSQDTTYADQKKAEKSAIEKFIASSHNIYYATDAYIHIDPINIIDDYTFFAQDTMTDVSKNQYVYFGNSGVYMQILRKGTGKKIGEGETKQIIARYVEFNIMADSVISGNYNYSYSPDIMDVVNTYGTFTASFNKDQIVGRMYATYSTTEVPSGWLVPFTYVNIGRYLGDTDDKMPAKVRLIVPHSQGTATARNSVYPCFYEITLEANRN